MTRRCVQLEDLQLCAASDGQDLLTLGTRERPHDRSGDGCRRREGEIEEMHGDGDREGVEGVRVGILSMMHKVARCLYERATSEAWWRQIIILSFIYLIYPTAPPASYAYLLHRTNKSRQSPIAFLEQTLTIYNDRFTPYNASSFSHQLLPSPPDAPEDTVAVAGTAGVTAVAGGGAPESGSPT